MASIVRTYYSWKIPTATDLTFDLQFQGRWTEVEMVIGVVVSCLPVMPRFFQHIGPGIYGVLPLGSSTKKKFAPSSWSTRDTNQLVIPGKQQGSGQRSGAIRDALNDSQVELKGEYINLDKHEVQQSRRATPLELVPTMADQPSTKREVLEHESVCV